MNNALSRTYDVAINSITQPAIFPDSLPPLIKKRWHQAVLVNTRADWKQMAQLCAITAINHFREHDYNPRDTDFRAMCQLARIAHLRGNKCHTEGIEQARRFDAEA